MQAFKQGVDIWTQLSKALAPLVVIPQTSSPVMVLINNMIGLVDGLDKKNQDAFEYIWKDTQKKFAVTKEARDVMVWELCLRSGYWIVTDQVGSARLSQERDLVLHREEGYFLAHSQEPNKPALEDVNYMVLKFGLRPAPVS